MTLIHISIKCFFKVNLVRFLKPVINLQQEKEGQNLERPTLEENPNGNERPVEASNFREPNPLDEEIQVILFK